MDLVRIVPECISVLSDLLLLIGPEGAEPPLFSITSHWSATRSATECVKKVKLHHIQLPANPEDWIKQFQVLVFSFGKYCRYSVTACVFFKQMLWRWFCWWTWTSCAVSFNCSSSAIRVFVWARTWAIFVWIIKLGVLMCFFTCCLLLTGKLDTKPQGQI